MEANVFDDAEVMQWREGIVKDGKEGWFISGKGDILDAAWLQFEGGTITPLS